MTARTSQASLGEQAPGDRAEPVSSQACAVRCPRCGGVVEQRESGRRSNPFLSRCGAMQAVCADCGLELGAATGGSSHDPW
jgi:hypothetical protein